MWHRSSVDVEGTVKYPIPLNSFVRPGIMVMHFICPIIVLMYARRENNFKNI